jgi:hypothetical protein
MKKLATVALLMVALLLAFAEPSLAWRGHYHNGGTRVFVGFGAYYPYYPYPYYYYPPPYYTYSPPPVVVQEPPVYVQQPQQHSTVQPAPVAPEAFWYYCPSSRGYYPSVQTCPEPWVKVPPRQD